jgi:hypothetical protein
MIRRVGLVTSGTCAGGDLRPVRLSERAERRTWIATTVFVVAMLVSVRFFYIGVLGVMTTFIAVRLARGPRLS